MKKNKWNVWYKLFLAVASAVAGVLGLQAMS